MRGAHFAGGDLVVGSPDEAEFAAGEGIAFGHTDGRPEDAAGHGSPVVDVAEASFGIEGGAGCVVGEVLEAGLVFFRCAENSGCGVAGEVGTVLPNPSLGSGLNRFGFAWIGSEEDMHAGPEAGSVESVNCERAVTALGASGAADEPRACAEGCIGESRIHHSQELAIADLHEFGVPGGERHTTSVSKNNAIGKTGAGFRRFEMRVITAGRSPCFTWSVSPARH
jgi:hypothetical protein